MNKISISLSKTKKSRSIELFFKKVFTQSEGKKEGKIVSKLSFKLAKLIDGENVIGIEAKIKTKIVGYIFLTKLQYKEDYLAYNFIATNLIIIKQTFFDCLLDTFLLQTLCSCKFKR